MFEYLSIFLLVSVLSHQPDKGEDILIFAGSVLKPALDEVAGEFRKNHHYKISISYGGSGVVLSQMELSKRGDIYMPASHDFMEMAKERNLILSESEKRVAYLVPAILVQRGNPAGISGIVGLSKIGLRIAMGNPESVAAGLYGIELLEHNKILEPVIKNIVAYTDSIEKLASLVTMGIVDAGIGWNVIVGLNPERIQTIMPAPLEIPRIAYISVAVSAFSKNSDAAVRFINFLVSDTGMQIFEKRGYITDLDKARRNAPHAIIGGKYELPEGFGKKR